jgi:hypothetical protein
MVFTIREMDNNKNSTCTMADTHSDALTRDPHFSVTTNPERLAVDISNDTTIDGKSWSSRVPNTSGQCSISYTCTESRSFERFLAGKDCPDR